VKNVKSQLFGVSVANMGRSRGRLTQVCVEMGQNGRERGN
jgi:hypothetical protein